MKIITAVLSVLITVLFPFTVFAEGGEVKARYESDFSNAEVRDLKDGLCLETTDGGKIEFSCQKADEGLRVVVTTVCAEENGAYEFVSEKLSNYGVQPFGYHISFYRDGKRVEPQGNIDVIITPVSDCEELPAYYCSSDFVTKQLTVRSDAKLKTRLANSGFYVFITPYENSAGLISLPPFTANTGSPKENTLCSIALILLCFFLIRVAAHCVKGTTQPED